MEVKGEYSLMNPKDEIERLNIQAMAWKPEAETLLDKIGVGAGWKCVDLGCGPMGILESLNWRVGTAGMVLGVDLNLNHVQAADNLIQHNLFENVRVLRGNLFNLAFQHQSFDLVHERFVFSQVGCDMDLLSKMIKLTHPGGMVVSQECDWASWNCYPVHLSWEKLKTALIACYEFEGGNINAGQRTFQMFRQAGLEDVQLRAAIMSLPIEHPYRSGMNRLALTLGERILNEGILTENEFHQTLGECDELMRDPNVIVISYVLCQVWGKVKRSDS
jgi:ubiquinone/menaquinone biosynthesis C-methylase UbiE